MSTRNIQESDLFIIKQWKTNDIPIRGIQASDLPIIKQWMVDERWNPGQHDVEVYSQAFPKKFLVVPHPTNNDIPMACILASQYGENSGFIGLLIVKEALRGNHLGQKLLKHALTELSTRDITLYAVEAQIGRYKHLNFNEIGNTQRYQSGKNPERPSENSTPLSYDTPRKELQPLTTLRQNDEDKEWDELCNRITNWLTESCTEHVNINFIKSLLDHEEITSIVKMDDENVISGLAILRPCCDGNYRLSIFAGDEASTMELAHQVMREVNFNAYRHDLTYKSKDALAIFMDTINPGNDLVKKFIENMNLVSAETTFKIMRKEREQTIEEDKSTSVEQPANVARHSLFSNNSTNNSAPRSEEFSDKPTNIATFSLEAG